MAMRYLQPQTAPALRAGHPLVAGITSVWYGNDVWAYGPSGKAPVGTSVGLDKVGYGMTGFTVTAAPLPNGSFGASIDESRFALIRIPTGTATNTISTAAVTGALMSRVTSGGNLQLVEKGVAVRITATGVVTAGEVCSVAATRDSTTCALYKNGVLLGTGTGRNTLVTGTPQIGLDSGTNPYNDLIFLHIAWNRVLSTAEIKSLADNPWQIFAPVKSSALAASTGAPGLIAPLLTNSQTFYSPTVTPSAVALTAPLLSNSQTFYSPTVTQGGATQTLTAPLLTNAQAFYSPTATPGAVALAAPLLTNTSSFFGPSVAPGAVTVSAPLLSNTQAFYSPTASPGAVALTAPLLTNISALYTPTVVNGMVVSPPYFENPNSFFAPTITPGAVTLTASLFTNSSTVFPARIVVAGDELTQILQILRNRQELNPTTGKFVLYDDDGVTVLREANAWEDAAGTIPYRGQALRRLDALH